MGAQSSHHEPLNAGGVPLNAGGVTLPTYAEGQAPPPVPTMCSAPDFNAGGVGSGSIGGRCGTTTTALQHTHTTKPSLASKALNPRNTIRRSLRKRKERRRNKQQNRQQQDGSTYKVTAGDGGQ